MESSESWTNSGIFAYFKFESDVIKYFTIDPKLSRVEQQAQKTLLGTKLVAGKCKTCDWVSKVHFGNPSNWVRHLSKVLFQLSTKMYIVCFIYDAFWL